MDQPQLGVSTGSMCFNSSEGPLDHNPFRGLQSSKG